MDTQAQTLDSRPFDAGRAVIQPDTGIVGRCESFRITYTVGELELREGGEILFFIPKCGFSSPHLYPDETAIAEITKGPPMDNSLPGMTWVETTTEPDVKFTVSLEPPAVDFSMRDQAGALTRVHPGFPGYPVRVTLTSGILKKGDTVTLLYGDTSSGSPGAVCGTYAHTALFRIWLDPSGDRSGPLLGFHEVLPPPSVKVLSEIPRKLAVTVPSVVKPHEPFTVTIVPRDRYDNVCERHRGEIRMEAKGIARLPEAYTFTGKENGVVRIDGLCAYGHEKSVVSARDIRFGSLGKSNPLLTSESGNPDRIYWGELHTHTGECDGLGTIEEALSYGRDVAGLDFGGTSTHDRMITCEDWHRICGITRDFNEDGRFVALPGYEYSESRCGGHKNVYFLDDFAPLFRHIDPGMENPGVLFGKLNGRKALVIPHHTPHPTMTTDWQYHDPTLQRLVEIYSEWGSSECIGGPRPICRQHQREDCPLIAGATVQDALAGGYRLGFTAGSDNHSGQLGYCDLMGRFGRRRAYHGGLTAVFAKELTRQAIWKALYNRRCYATTGARMIIDFRIEGHRMGEEIELEAPAGLPERRISARVIGADRLDRAELLRNNRVIHTVRGESDEMKIEYTDRDSLEKTGPASDGKAPVCFYYLRVIQKDGEMGWSSPIWISWRSSGQAICFPPRDRVRS